MKKSNLFKSAAAFFFSLFFAALFLSSLWAQKKNAPPAKAKTTTTKPAPKVPKANKEAEEEDLTFTPAPPPPPKPRSASQPLGRIVLVPLDDRPAVAQFAQMIGAIGDYDVQMPPHELLGNFTKPGDTTKILEWLGVVDFTQYKSLANYKAPPQTDGNPKNQIPLKDIYSNEDKEKARRFINSVNYSQADAVIVSADMIAYGGLVASRAPDTSLQDALKRLEYFRWLKKEHPNIPIYAFNVLMRVAPTASRQTRAWRDDVARWAELMDRVPKTNDAKLAAELEELKKKLDRKVIDDYMTARRRDLQINLAMIKLYEEHIIDQLIFLQDDAREYGLHRHDQLILRAKLQALGFADEIPIYNGADEGSLSLVSRAALDLHKQKIKIAVVYSSEKSRKIIAPYEDHPLEFTVQHQIEAAGGQIAQPTEKPDYTLYINAPETNESEFTLFSKNLVADLKAGKPVALADILFPAPHRSGADERLIAILKTENLLDKLTGYAAWNTAGNALGTAIPAANMRIFSQKFFENPTAGARSTNAYLEFLFHRFAGDYIYHDIVRLEINNELRKPPAVPTDELMEVLYNRTNKQVQEKMTPLLEKFFTENFKGRTYNFTVTDGSKHSLKVNNLKDLKIYLPWARTFESTIEYRFESSIN